ncbi:hypothetical protein OUZ56_004532 [Daphnia magna]|uniref:Uncharacterized protein n=1 Tax=Daphnia magna TaxID=35525 RepID=A0ABQ9YQ62_9CRUS|nr:hypothetical protein OUZ56_004532 [Daphnia magna]
MSDGIRQKAKANLEAIDFLGNFYHYYCCMPIREIWQTKRVFALRAIELMNDELGSPKQFLLLGLSHPGWPRTMTMNVESAACALQRISPSP